MGGFLVKWLLQNGFAGKITFLKNAISPSAKSGVFFTPVLSSHSPLATADGCKRAIPLSPPNENMALLNKKIFKMSVFLVVKC